MKAVVIRTFGDPDGLEVDLPSRARLPVRITLAHGPQVPLELELYGPGDVTGLDTRAIVRTEPRADTTNFPPDQFAAIEFDPPDLPWLLTPARAGTNDQLRPWLALVVVARGPEVEIDTAPNRPLPRLSVEPASTATELPDLGESWAWAHAHMVEAGGGGDVPAALAAQPDLNVSRLLCPRRLEPDRDYIACLVPTTEAGRRLYTEARETARAFRRCRNDHHAPRHLAGVDALEQVLEARALAREQDGDAERRGCAQPPTRFACTRRVAGDWFSV